VGSICSKPVFCRGGLISSFLGHGSMVDVDTLDTDEELEKLY